MITSTLPDKSENPGSLKKSSQQFEYFSTNVAIARYDLLRAFYGLCCLQFYDSSDQ